MSSPSYHKSATISPTLPTHVAAQQNDVSLLAEYVGEGQDLLDEETGENVFHAAARGGSIEAIRWLLENRSSDISPRHKANNGHTPAHAAAVYNHMQALKLILEHDKVQGGLMAADQDENGLTILHLAVLQGDEHMVKYILKKYPHLAFCANESGDLPVHFAAASGFLEIIKILVETSGSHIVNERDTNGTSAVYFAAQEGKIDCLKYFIKELNCDPISQDNEGMTLLHAATQEGHFQMVQFIASEIGPEGIKTTTNDRATVIHAAADVGAVEILDWLLCQPGCEELVNARDSHGFTPAHDAVEASKIGSLRILLHHGADLTLKNVDGKTPYDSAQTEALSSFLQDYKTHGQSVLSSYKPSSQDSDSASIRSTPSERRTRTRSSTRTSYDEQVEISDARKVALEVTGKREFRRQESLLALQTVGVENGVGEDTPDEEPPAPAPALRVERYPAGDGSIYTKVKKNSKSGDHPQSPTKGISPKKIKKNSSGGNLSDLSDFSSPLSQQLSPHGRVGRTKSPLADVNHYSHGNDDDMNSVYSNWTSVSHRTNSHLHPDSRTNLSEYSDPASQIPHMPQQQMGPGFRGYPQAMYPPGMYGGAPPPHQPRSVEERMRMEAMHGKYPVPPQGYPPYPYPYPPQQMAAARGRGRGYPPYPPHPYMYPGYYPPYGAPGMQGPFPRGPPPGQGVPRSRSTSSGAMSKIVKKAKEGKTKQGKKKKSNQSDTVSESRFIGGNSEIGYGPSTVDGPVDSRSTGGKRGQSHSEVPDDFHPPPPPSTKGGEMKEFVEHGNFIMVKRTQDSLAPKVHPSGVRLQPARHLREYDGRYDDFIERDPYEEEIDDHFNIGVLIEAATVAIIGSVVGIKDLRASMVSMKKKNKPKKSTGQPPDAAGGGKLSSNTPKKIKSYQDLWGGGALEKDLSHMSEHEKYAFMISDHGPTNWGTEQEQQQQQEEQEEQEEEKKPLPSEVKKRPRPPKRKDLEPSDSPYTSDMVKTLSKQYSASRTSLNTLGTGVGSLGGDLGMSLQARQSSLLNLMAIDMVTDPYGINSDPRDEGGFDEVESRIQGKTEAEIRRAKVAKMRDGERTLSTGDPPDENPQEPTKPNKVKKKAKKSKGQEKKGKESGLARREEKKAERPLSTTSSQGRGVEQMEIDFESREDDDMQPPPIDSDENSRQIGGAVTGEEAWSGWEEGKANEKLSERLNVEQKQEARERQEVEQRQEAREKQEARERQEVENKREVVAKESPFMDVTSEQRSVATGNMKYDQLHAMDVTMESHSPPPPKASITKGPEFTEISPEPEVSVAAEVLVAVETATTEKKQAFNDLQTPAQEDKKKKKSSSSGEKTASAKKSSKSEEKTKRKSTAKDSEKRTSKTSKDPSKKPKSKVEKEEGTTQLSAEDPFKTVENQNGSFDMAGFQFPSIGFGMGIYPTPPPSNPAPIDSPPPPPPPQQQQQLQQQQQQQQPTIDDQFGDIFADLSTSDSMANLLKGIEDEIKEMESMTKKPKEPPVRIVDASYSAPSKPQVAPGKIGDNSLAQELMKFGEMELSFSSPPPQSNTRTAAATPPPQPVQNGPPSIQSPGGGSEPSLIIEKAIVNSLLDVSHKLSTTTLSAQDVFHYQNQHNQLVSDIVRQSLVAKEKGMDTASLAQAIASALSQLDNFTVSQVLAGINQARSLSDIKQSGLDASDSSLSLTSEIETAIRKFQEEQLKEQQKQFKSQTEFQEFMRRQAEEQSKVYLQMQEQSQLFSTMQIEQAQTLADAQRKMNEQELRLRKTEENVRVHMSSKDRKEEAEKERKLRELEMRVKMYEEMRTQQEDYHTHFQQYYEGKMEEMMSKVAGPAGAGQSKKKEKKKKKRSTLVNIDNVSSSDDELMPPIPSLKQQILQHSEAKEHQAKIYRNDMLTEDSVREYAENKIPKPPPHPTTAYLLGRLKRSDTRSRVSEVYKSLEKWEKGDEESSDSEDQFVEPVHVGGTKRASLKHNEPEQVAPQPKSVAERKVRKSPESGQQASSRRVGGGTEDSPFEQFDYQPKRQPEPKELPPGPASEPVKNKFLDNLGGGIDLINAHKKDTPKRPDHDFEGASNELKMVLEKRRKAAVPGKLP